MRAHLYQVLKIVIEFTRVFQMNLATVLGIKMLITGLLSNTFRELRIFGLA